jgi:CRP-like cAMP-binding protein
MLWFFRMTTTLFPTYPPFRQRSGDKGESFYVVERGRFDIVVNGTKVAEFGEGTPNMSFGEVGEPACATFRP